MFSVLAQKTHPERKKIMNKRESAAKRFFSVLLALCLIIPCLPTFTLPARADTVVNSNLVADPSTADNYMSMLGTSADGNRYSGRVWFDKSVFTAGSESSLPADAPSIDIDSSFLVIGSALGSTTSVTTTTSSEATLDVVLILDNSQSMDDDSRLSKAVSAANSLINKILAGNDKNRIAVVTYSEGSSLLLDLEHYTTKDTYLTIESKGKVKATAVVESTNQTVTETSMGYKTATAQQSGLYTGMKLLADETDTSGRVPVVILLTDGIADYASATNWNAPVNTTVNHKDNTITAGVILSTILTGAYMRASVEDNYKVAPTVYGIGVDIPSAEAADAAVIMNPSVYFTTSSASSLGSTAYSWYEDWAKAESTVTKSDGSFTWNFNQLPSTGTSTVTKQDIKDNINYIDTYYTIDNADLVDTFDKILVEINEKAFVPIVDTKVSGDTEISVPLTYVDFIGNYMEVKEFKAVTLFGSTYSVSKSLAAPVITDTVEDGVTTRSEVTTYLVESKEIINTVLGVTFDIQDAVTITVKDTYTYDPVNEVQIGVSKQEVRVVISSSALPLIYDKVVNNQGTITYETNRDSVKPIRIYYTVGISDDVVDANGQVITDVIDDEYLENNTNTDGTINFYSNAYGEMNQYTVTANDTLELLYGDSHAAANISEENRYYYHQNNYPVYITATNSDGSDIDWDKGEYGVLYYKGNGIDQTLLADYKTEYLTYADFASLKDTDEVYTLVAFYRPTSGGSGEAVGYLVYTEWQYLKSAITFYDNVNGVYINGYDSSTGAFITSKDDGYAVSTSVIENYIAEKSLKNSDIVCALGIDTWRTSRLHNMTVTKEKNTTNTASLVVAPVYNEDSIHSGNMVSWLGNNGRLTVAPQQGISVEKIVSGELSQQSFDFTVT